MQSRAAMPLRLLLLVYLLAGVASAQPHPSAEQFEKGKAAYRLGEFDEAIAFFREGYRLKPDPVFLYNIALAHRGKEEFEKAIFFYQSYLREAPNAPILTYCHNTVKRVPRAATPEADRAQSIAFGRAILKRLLDGSLAKRHVGAETAGDFVFEPL